MCRELASPLVSLGTRVSISSSEHVYVQDYCSEEGNYEFSLPPLQSMNTRFPSKVTVLNFWGPSFPCGVSGGSILQYARTIKHLACRTGNPLPKKSESPLLCDSREKVDDLSSTYGIWPELSIVCDFFCCFGCASSAPARIVGFRTKQHRMTL